MMKQIAPKTFALNGNKNMQECTMDDATCFLCMQVTTLLQRITDIPKDQCAQLALTMVQNADWDILYDQSWDVKLGRRIEGP